MFQTKESNKHVPGRFVIYIAESWMGNPCAIYSYDRAVLPNNDLNCLVDCTWVNINTERI